LRVEPYFLKKNIYSFARSRTCYGVTVCMPSMPSSMSTRSNSLMLPQSFQLELCQCVRPLDGQICWSGMCHSQVQPSYFFYFFSFCYTLFFFIFWVDLNNACTSWGIIAYLSSSPNLHFNLICQKKTVIIDFFLLPWCQILGYCKLSYT
jgi:hypothetical protein